MQFDEEKVFAYIDAHRDEYIELLRPTSVSPAWPEPARVSRT